MVLAVRSYPSSREGTSKLSIQCIIGLWSLSAKLNLGDVKLTYTLHSVESPRKDGTPGAKTVRPMRSIDAMAASGSGEADKAVVAHTQKSDTLRPPLRNADRQRSDWTIRTSSPPPEMAVLSPQRTPASRREPDHGDLKKWQARREPPTPQIQPLGRDSSPVEAFRLPPRAEQINVYRRLPSPRRSIELPYRPKIQTSSSPQSSSTDNQTSSSPISSLRSSKHRYEPVLFKPFLEKRLAERKENSTSPTGSAQPLLGHSSSSNISESNTKDYVSQPNACAKTLRHVLIAPLVLQDEFKTIHLFGNNSSEYDLPIYQDPVGSSPITKSILDWPPRDHIHDPYDEIENVCGGISPTKLVDMPDTPDDKTCPSSPQMNSSDVGMFKNFWRFDMGRWLGDGQKELGSSDIDHDEPSEGTIKPDEASPADNVSRGDMMGGRVEFDLKRSERNMRYNSLAGRQPPTNKTSGRADKGTAASYVHFPSSPPVSPPSKNGQSPGRSSYQGNSPVSPLGDEHGRLESSRNPSMISLPVFDADPEYTRAVLEGNW
jgi:hypothetical protein